MIDTPPRYRPKSWSYSSLTSYETCPHRVSFPYRADRPADNAAVTARDAAAAKGTDIHAQIEVFLRLGGDCPFPQLPFDSLAGKELFIEQRYGVDAQWQPVEYKHAWFKFTPDLVVVDGDLIHTIDFKSNRHAGNEIKHAQQLQAYNCGLAAHFPHAVQFSYADWYTEDGRVVASRPIDRDRIHAMQVRWGHRGNAMLADAVLPPRPTRANCKWCFERDRCEYTYEE